MIDEPYDSRVDTYAHIAVVRGYLLEIATDLIYRGHDHDLSKLEEPEKSTFDEFTPKLEGSSYGSDEYKGFLAGMSDALQHHYSVNRHHPEHFPKGVGDMTLVDVMEMLADWKAATLRHADGDLKRSIDLNAERFGYGDEVWLLLLNTARAYGWLERE